jgi:osmotically-inducible protein OsmY
MRKNMMKRMFKSAISIKSIITIAALNLALSSCAYTTAVSSGASAVYDRHSIQKGVSDQLASIRTYGAIYVDHKEEYKDTHVSIATFNKVTLLIGQVNNPDQKMGIAQLAKEKSDTNEIYNFITVEKPTSPLIRVSDSWITSKIKAQLIAINDIDPTQVKVVTENGIVYLMGIVPPTQANIAVDVARTTAGVQRVVKIFSYLHVSKNPVA